MTKTRCSDRENCVMMAQCIEQNAVTRERMESDKSYYFSPQVKIKLYIDKDYSENVEIFIMYCPFCGYRFDDGI